MVAATPQNQTQPKKPQFFMATSEELKEGYKAKIFNAEAYLYCLIKSKRAAGWEWYLNVRQFCAEWEIRERTFYRALSKLRVKNLISWRSGDNTVVVWWDKKGSKIANVDSSDSANSPNLYTIMAPQHVAEAVQDVAEAVQDVAEAVQDVAEQNPESLAVAESCNPSSSLQIDPKINTDFQEEVCVVLEKVLDQDPEGDQQAECEQQKFHHDEYEINQDPIPEPPTTLLEETNQDPIPESCTTLLDKTETLQVADKTGHEGQGSAAPSHKTLQKPLQKEKWVCPGTDAQKDEFLKYKGGLLVKAKKCELVEARTAALAWANHHPESANLLWEDWQQELKRQQANQNTVRATVPEFHRMSSEEHASLLETFMNVGGEAFIALCSWHKYWLQFAITLQGKKHIDGLTPEIIKQIRRC